MKRTISILLMVIFLCTGCARTLVTSDNTEYPPYEFLNKSEYYSLGVCYSISVGNVIWAVLLAETLIAPIIIAGWYVWVPKRLKKSIADNCNIDDE